MIHSIARILQFAAIFVSCLGCLSSCIYYLTCLRAAWIFIREQKAGGGRTIQFVPAVSILKPLKGADPDMYESFRSHCLQDYPEHEIVFGVSDANDPAIESVKQLQRDFPASKIKWLVCPAILGANVKVSNLAQILNAATYDHLIVDDSDIRVESDYLRRVMAPLADPAVGLVTCLYRGVPAATVGSRLEALGISTDFCVGVLAARQLERGIRFGLGSTLAFRRAELERIGGFESFVDFLADDYELGRHFADLGLRVVLSDVVVETHLPAYDMRGFLAHQLRWARGVRDARSGGYFGLVLTYGLMWALFAVIAAHSAPWSWGVFGVTVLLRLAIALSVGKSVLQDAQLLKNLWLLPLRDLVAVAVWIASFAGHTVTWRGDRFELKNGRLIRIAPPARE
jgi:ceramide glucosyltransferase